MLTVLILLSRFIPPKTLCFVIVLILQMETLRTRFLVLPLSDIFLHSKKSRLTYHEGTIASDVRRWKPQQVLLKSVLPQLNCIYQKFNTIKYFNSLWIGLHSEQNTVTGIFWSNVCLIVTGMKTRCLLSVPLLRLYSSLRCFPHSSILPEKTIS